MHCALLGGRVLDYTGQYINKNKHKYSKAAMCWSYMHGCCYVSARVIMPGFLVAFVNMREFACASVHFVALSGVFSLKILPDLPGSA